MNISVTLFIIIMAAMAAAYIIFKLRNNKLKLLKISATVFAVILVLITISNFYSSNRMPLMLKASESYIMDYNETKSVSGTRVKLKKVLLDLGSINATYSVQGREKVVGVELKKGLDNEAPIMDVPGLWVGGKVLPAHELIGMSYGSDEFITPLYLVFYLSNGENVSFKIEDRANIGSAVKAFDVEKTINYKDHYIKFTSFFKGLNYSSAAFESNFNPNSQIEVKLIVNGSEIESGPSGWSGSGTHYQGSFGFDPVDAENVQIKVVNTVLNQEDIINVNLK